MPAYELTPERLAAYTKLFDFRSQFVKAARQILDAGGIEAAAPGDGIKRVPRHFTSLDFQRGAATGRQTHVALGGWRYREYSQFTGTLSIWNTAPMAQIEKTDLIFDLEDHIRLIDELCAKEQVLFMEHMEPFSAQLLPNLDVQEIFPIEPDERPVNEREVDGAFMRWRVKFEIRKTAWPTS